MRNLQTLSRRGRLAQRLNKLEGIVRDMQPPEVDPSLMQTDEEWADVFGKILWWPKGPASEVGPLIWRSSDWPVGHPRRAYLEAVELARQNGHEDYHPGLRPYAMAIWLDAKPTVLRGIREREKHGTWVWDIPPRFNTMTMEEFKQLSTGEKIDVLRDQGVGHYSKTAKRKS